MTSDMLCMVSAHIVILYQCFITQKLLKSGRMSHARADLVHLCLKLALKSATDASHMCVMLPHTTQA